MRLLGKSAWAVLAIAVCASAAHAGYAWTEYNGHWYALTNSHGTWSEVRAEAQAAGGDLAVINDAAENAFVAELARPARPAGNPDNPYANGAWIGYLLDKGDWGWVDGSDAAYTNHAGNWPAGGVHAYIVGNDLPSPYEEFRGQWGDNPDHDVADSDVNLVGVIEAGAHVNPEPATLMVLMGGSLALLRRKFRRA